MVSLANIVGLLNSHFFNIIFQLIIHFLLWGRNSTIACSPCHKAAHSVLLGYSEVSTQKFLAAAESGQQEQIGLEQQ